MEHIFPKKVYKTQKKYLRNICKPLRLTLQEWISQMIKLDDYLESFPVPDGVTAEKISQEEFGNWNLRRKEEAELQKLFKKRIACTIKEQDKSDDEKPNKPRHKRREGQTKRYGRRILRQQSKQHGADKGKRIATTMAPATMTHLSVTLLNLTRSTFSGRTILRSNRGSGRSGL
eukprot:6763959-Ditylum_brightwellii.AAC.1